MTALSLAASTMFMGAGTASAAQTTKVSGTVNCNGSTTTYQSVRKMTGYANVELFVTKADYSDGYWPNGPFTSMGFLVKITKTGTVITSSVPGVNAWAKFDTADYIPGTTFVMGASMRKSSGTCHNDWAGELHY